ncbi:MAG: ATP-binding protein [Betaproteobacteria bacterium]|nr:ATP-binding protein [Betaproteobacteria bacterium]
MFVSRHLSSTLAHARASFPAVLVTGARQTGKTTLLRHQADPDTAYATLDDPLTRSFARADPKGFLTQFPASVILDEVQYVPELLTYLKIAIDADRRPGRFLLSGSQQFPLMRGVSESLAGRVAVLDLLPFSLAEYPEADLAGWLWHGGYPACALNPAARDLWLRSYVQTYLERDVRELLELREVAAFERFLMLCAARHGQLLNMAHLSRDCGVTQPTIKHWLSVLEASYLIYRLPAWSGNLGKRLTRSPKLYFVDPALALYLTRHPSPASVLPGPMGGAIFEGLIVTEALKACAARGKTPPLYHLRSQDGTGIDLLLDLGSTILPIEIKLTATPALGHLASLRALRKSGSAPWHPQGWLVCNTAEVQPMPDGMLAIPWSRFPAMLAELLS